MSASPTQAQHAVHCESVEVATWVRAAAQDAERIPSELFRREPVCTRGLGLGSFAIGALLES
tara:strand:+ start:11215 stop:11400 length:186 start_codon:yes stop_codon:yes gene_type:complete